MQAKEAKLFKTIRQRAGVLLCADLVALELAEDPNLVVVVRGLKRAPLSLNVRHHLPLGRYVPV